MPTPHPYALAIPPLKRGTRLVFVPRSTAPSVATCLQLSVGSIRMSAMRFFAAQCDMSCGFSDGCRVAVAPQNAVREAGGITVLCLLIRRFVSDDGHSSTGGVSMAHGAYSSSSIVSSSLATVALSVLQTLTSSNHENGQAVRLAGGILPIVQLLRRGPQVGSGLTYPVGRETLSRP